MLGTMAIPTLLLPLLLLVTAFGGRNASVESTSIITDWISISPRTQFRPAPAGNNNQRLRDAQERFLATEEEASSSFQGDTAIFVESQETYYNGYQQGKRREEMP